VSATLHESPFETRITNNQATLDSAILRATLAPVTEQAVRGGDWRTDFCLVLLGAAAAFGTYTEIMEQKLAEPGRHILTSFFAATVFVSLFERIGGYRLKQVSRLHWQFKRTVTTWGFTVAVVLLVAFLTKTSENVLDNV
jgi:hypothetical protein